MEKRLTRVRRVYQTSATLRNNCCLPACISSLTGIPMREVPYERKYREENWILHIANFLDSRGFVFTDVDNPEPGRLYLMYYQWYTNKRSAAHICVSRGRELVHDPIKYLLKQFIKNEHETGIITHNKRFFEILAKRN